MKWIYIIMLTLIFNGCDLLQSQEEKAKEAASQKIAFEKRVQESKDIQLQKLSNQTQRELALLKSKKELAKIEKDKELEKIRLQAELEKQRIVLAQKKEQALFEQKLQQKNQLDNMELKRYLMIILALLIITCSFFIFYYLKKKREDKLIAYNDNLQKYFNQKENEARIKIAEKMLDTITSGKLDKNQENQLISAFSGNVNGEYQKQINNKTEIINKET